jgi:hypothetical protein
VVSLYVIITLWSVVAVSSASLPREGLCPSRRAMTIHQAHETLPLRTKDGMMGSDLATSRPEQASQVSTALPFMHRPDRRMSRKASTFPR